MRRPLLTLAALALALACAGGEVGCGSTQPHDTVRDALPADGGDANPADGGVASPDGGDASVPGDAGDAGDAGVGPNPSSVIWAGGFDDTTSPGTYLQWHGRDDTTHAYMNGVPVYARAVQYGGQANGHVGNGELTAIVTTSGGGLYEPGPVHCGSHAVRMTVKNGANDNDVAGDNGDWDLGVTQDQRRSELWMTNILYPVYGHMTHLGEHWWGLAVYVPTDWDSTDNSGWNLVHQIKGSSTSAASPQFAISLTDTGWGVQHLWDDYDNSQFPFISQSDIEWYHRFSYDAQGAFVGSGVTWADGVADFPDPLASQAALASVAKGVWTYWVVHALWDYRGPSQGGSGFIEVYKKEEGGDWTQVLDIDPRTTTAGGETFEMGIGIDQRAGGNGPTIGMYGSRSFHENASSNRTLYFDCLKITDETGSFIDVSPDGTVP